MLKMLLHKVSFTCNFKFVYVSQDEGQKHSTKKKKSLWFYQRCDTTDTNHTLKVLASNTHPFLESPSSNPLPHPAAPDHTFYTLLLHHSDQGREQRARRLTYTRLKKKCKPGAGPYPLLLLPSLSFSEKRTKRKARNSIRHLPLWTQMMWQQTLW